jgi:hypothetical protein
MIALALWWLGLAVLVALPICHAIHDGQIDLVPEEAQP